MVVVDVADVDTVAEAGAVDERLRRQRLRSEGWSSQKPLRRFHSGTGSSGARATPFLTGAAHMGYYLRTIQPCLFSYVVDHLLLG